MPVPSSEYLGGGIAIESMSAAQVTPAAQAAVEKKVRQQATVLEKADMGYRSAIGFHAPRLVAAIPSPAYGSIGKCNSEYASRFINNSDSRLTVNAFLASTPLTPASVERFDNKCLCRGVGSSKIDTIETP